MGLTRYDVGEVSQTLCLTTLSKPNATSLGFLREMVFLNLAILQSDHLTILDEWKIDNFQVPRRKHPVANQYDV